MSEGAERRDGADNWALSEGARGPCDRPARLPALHHGDFLRRHRAGWTGDPGRVATALHPASSATKGGPLIGGGRCRRILGLWLRSPRLQDATPRSAKQTSLDDALNERGESAVTGDLR